MKVKFVSLLFFVMLSGCVVPNSRVAMPSASQSNDADLARALWNKSARRCAENSVEIMTLDEVLKIVKAWDSYVDLPKQAGFESPNIVSVANTRYPDSMFGQGVSGSVYLLIQIDSKGKVADVHAVCASRTEFIPNAIAALKKYRYEPAKVKGVAVRSTAFQPIIFVAP